MGELTHEKKVKEVGIDDDYLCIELFSGLRLMGPLHTNPVRREPIGEPEPCNRAEPVTAG
jgi:hypothetical protein